MENNYKKVSQVLWTVLFLNFGVAFLKIIVGKSINSTSLVADGFHSISDGTSNIVGLIGIGFASKPVDKEHPYGHNKFEVISGLFIGAMLLFLGIKIVSDVFDSLKNPVVLNITSESLIALVITLFINIFVCSYEYKVGKKLNSYILISDSLHTKSDIFVSLGVLGTLVGLKLGFPPIIDSIASLVVSLFIFHSSYEILKPTIDVLVDSEAVDSSEITKVLDTFSEIKCYHDIRSRGSENNIHVDMHVMIDPETTVDKAHELSHDIEDKIREITNENAQVIVHIEPYYKK